MDWPFRFPFPVCQRSELDGDVDGDLKDRAREREPRSPAANGLMGLELNRTESTRGVVSDEFMLSCV